MPATKLTADDLDWEEPRRIRSTGGGVVDDLCTEIAEMRAALTARRGSWAVLIEFEKPVTATARANQLRKRREGGDTRLLGLEFAGRKMLDAGSKLYVRHMPA